MDILEDLMPTVLMQLEESYAVRPGQPKTGTIKFDAAVFIAQAILYASGKAETDVASKLSLIIKKMKDAGQLGGHGSDDPPLIIFDSLTGERLISEEQLEEIEKRNAELNEASNQAEQERQAAENLEASNRIEASAPPRYKLPDQYKQIPKQQSEMDFTEGQSI